MEPLPKELMDLEQQLRSLVPQTPHTSREQLLYQAGWEAALAQQAGSCTATRSTPSKTARFAGNSYWAAACALLCLLSTALGWQVWQQPRPGEPALVTTAPQLPRVPTPAATPRLAITEPTFEIAEPSLGEQSAAPWLNYLELRERVTRGGLSMWPVSTPARGETPDATSLPPRDWQEELFRETL